MTIFNSIMAQEVNYVRQILSNAVSTVTIPTFTTLLCDLQMMILGPTKIRLTFKTYLRGWVYHAPKRFSLGDRPCGIGQARCRRFAMRSMR